MEPAFLELEDVLQIHADQIERYGGRSGLRDLGLLESALAMPRAGTAGEYFHGGLHAMAAAYLFHLVKNHPFIDGNKRVGAMAAYVFLRMNGLELECTNAALVRLVLDVARGKANKLAVAAFFKRHAGR
jgi:death-on-curing protein